MLGAQDRARALNSQPDRWLVQGGLPLEPKHRNGGLVDVLAGEEVFDRFGMHANLMTKESASDSTPDCAVRSVSVAPSCKPGCNRILQIGAVSGRRSPSADQRATSTPSSDGAAHQPNRTYPCQRSPLCLTPAPDLLHHRPMLAKAAARAIQ